MSRLFMNINPARLRWMLPPLMAMVATLPLAAAPSASTATEPAVEITATLPAIPDRFFSLRDFGGVGDGKTWNTDAFARAIAAVASAGGGRLVVPPGIYKTKPFALTSRLDLHLEAGAIIKAPDALADYGLADPAVTPPPAGHHLPPFITGQDLEDVAITGGGTIDGSGAIFWPWSRREARRNPPGRVILDRPPLILVSGRRMHFSGVTLTNSPKFHLLPRGEDITIEHLRILAPRTAPNTDAINPSGRRIVIRHCEIDTGDDNVAIQSGSRGVLIEDLTCRHGHGISIGSPTRQGISHVVVRRCTFDGTLIGLRIKSYRGNGGEVHDIRYSDITMTNVKRPIDLNLRYNGNAGLPTDIGPREAEPGQIKAIPHFHGIHYANITITGADRAGRIVGLPEQNARNVTFTNVQVQAGLGFLVQDARDITFDGVQIKPANGEPLVLDHATVNWNGRVLHGPLGGSPVPFY